MNRSNIKLSVVPEIIEKDDRTLVELFSKAKKDIIEKEKMLKDSQIYFNKNDYLRFVIVKHAYDFAKEEHDLLYNEIVKRGLIQG